MTSEKRYDLSSVEPLKPAPEDDEIERQEEHSERVGMVAAAAAGSTPAVGVAAEQVGETPPKSNEEAPGGEDARPR